MVDFWFCTPEAQGLRHAWPALLAHLALLSIPKLHLKQTQIYKHFFSVFWPLFFV